MAFQQLHYTSCQDGPAGYSGFQFSATTPGTAPAVLREVQELTVYQPPARLLAGPGLGEPDAYPVMFSHAASPSTGATITAQVVFAGTDYSGRPGNYFAHALVTATPEADFGPVLPTELWRADLWQREPGHGADLPELPGPLRPGPIDPAGAQAFLDAQGLASLLAELLTAVSQAIAGAPPVLLACRDATECAWCIAALSYLLGERLGRQLTFTTYCHRPESARFHVIGILSDVRPPEAGLGFQFFDLASGLTPGGEIHPLASLLADTGVQAAAALWGQATALASGAEKSFGDWLPVVTTAAGLLGRPLTPAERTDVARWAASAAGHLPAAAAGAVLGLLLAQPAEPLTTERLIQLLGLAGQAGAADQVAYIEDLLIEDAVGRISAGQPVRPAWLTERGSGTARDRAVQLLDNATARTALAVLDWAVAWQLGLPEACLEQYGRGFPIGEPPAPELAQLLRRSTAIRRGLLAQLDGAAPELASAVLAGPLGSGIRREELAGFPTLAELWLLQAADQGRVGPLRALDEIADARATAGRTHRIDQALLRRLWPDGCPPGQLVELLDIDEPPDDVVRWLSAEAGALAAYWEPDDDWYRLAGAVASHPAREVLAPADLQIMLTAAQAGPLLIRARASAPGGDADVFAELFTLYQTATDSRMRGVLDGDLPALLAVAEPLGPALRGCPDPVVLALGRELAGRLTAPQADVALAARVFAARADPAVAGQPAQASQLAAACEPVRSWSRRDLAALGRALDGDRAAAKLFGTWRGPTRSARFWRRS